MVVWRPLLAGPEHGRTIPFSGHRPDRKLLIEAAKNRGCLIFWIAVSSTTFEDSPLAKFQGAIPPSAPLDLMSEPEQSKTLTEIYRKMKAAVSVE
jgi:hypothetical protein